MSVAFTFHWWYIPVALAVIGALLLWRAETGRDSWGGLFVFLFALFFFFCAVISALVGWIAS